VAGTVFRSAPTSPSIKTRHPSPAATRHHHRTTRGSAPPPSTPSSPGPPRARPQKASRSATRSHRDLEGGPLADAVPAPPARPSRRRPGHFGAFGFASVNYRTSASRSPELPAAAGGQAVSARRARCARCRSRGPRRSPSVGATIALDRAVGDHSAEGLALDEALHSSRPRHRILGTFRMLTSGGRRTPGAPGCGARRCLLLMPALRGASASSSPWKRVDVRRAVACRGGR